MRSSAALAIVAALSVTGTAFASDLEVAGSGAHRESALSGELAAALPRLAAAEKGPVWVAWEVPATSSLRDSCCLDRRFHRAVCQLDTNQQSWGASDRSPGGGILRVLVRTSGGRIDDVRSVASGCGLDAGSLAFVHLTGVNSEQSVALLAGVVDSHPAAADAEDDDDDDAHGALSALAFHAGGAADAALRRLAAPGQPTARRVQVLFWIGQARGLEGVRYLETVVRGDESARIRKKAVFALSQSDAAAEAAKVVVDVARHDRDPELRGEALFWLAQMDAPGAAGEVFARVSDDPSLEVRKKAIFALTQLPKDGGVPLLMRVAREQRQRELRKEAIFWLGQSDDPRALDFFEQVLGQSQR